MVEANETSKQICCKLLVSFGQVWFGSFSSCQTQVVAFRAQLMAVKTLEVGFAEVGRSSKCKIQIEDPKETRWNPRTRMQTRTRKQTPKQFLTLL